MNKMRVYLDASVLGGYFDEEFEDGSRSFFDGLFDGEVTALISDTLVGELAGAPEHVQDLLQRVLSHEIERLQLCDNADELRDAYLVAGVLSPKWSNDALHVAQAVVARADVIVSWNFKHLVNPMRIRGFNGINASQGYGPVVIMTPEDLARTWRQSPNEEEQDV